VLPLAFGVAVAEAVAVALGVTVGVGGAVGLDVSVGVGVAAIKPTAVMWMTAGGPPEQVIEAALSLTSDALQVVSSSVMAVTVGISRNGRSKSTSYRM